MWYHEHYLYRKRKLENEVYYPDFTIRHPVSGKEIIWEHFGMMHDPDYVNKTAQKARTYILNGYIPNETLLMTFENESHPFDVQEIIDIIERWIL